ncbi:MAG TPA: Gfo/Idh/MocA family oxidoreductase [Stellaceae bacterium]|nr:Gfo/Idh/MocA family oxidoreductase [Stellaceae bacterium]
MADDDRPDRVVIVGGGRWARVLVPELVGLLARDVPLAIVSPGSAADMQRWLRKNAALTGLTVDIGTDFPACANTGELALAIVANRPVDHVSAAAAMIERGYHVLVEKPLAIDPGDARRLVALGQRSRRTVMAGLTQLFAPYIQAFRELLPFAPGEIDRFDLAWQDPAEETRYGEIKRPDAETGIALDLVPHAWSLARALVSTGAPMTMALSKSNDAETEITVEARIGDCAGTFRLSRAAPARRRRLDLWTATQTATLDFTKGPMIATIDGAPPVLLPERVTGGGAIAREWRYFLARARDIQAGIEPPHHPACGAQTIEAVELACAIDRAVQARRRTR